MVEKPVQNLDHDQHPVEGGDDLPSAPDGAALENPQCQA